MVSALARCRRHIFPALRGLVHNTPFSVSVHASTRLGYFHIKMRQLPKGSQDILRQKPEEAEGLGPETVGCPGQSEETCEETIEAVFGETGTGRQQISRHMASAGVEPGSSLTEPIHREEFTHCP